MPNGLNLCRWIAGTHAVPQAGQASILPRLAGRMSSALAAELACFRVSIFGPRSSIVGHFKFERDAELAEYPTALGREVKAARSRGRERHEQTDLTALRADFLQ